MALRVTWVIAPTGISAHAVTGFAIIVALMAAASFAWGSLGGCLCGAGLLQLWYLLDHVDGQIARLRGSSSLDGMQLDFLMHHVVNLTLPCGLGYGIWRATGQEIWLPIGFACAVGLLLLGLANDTRYKAFMARLEGLDGIPLVVRHGAYMDDQPRLTTDTAPETAFWRAMRYNIHFARKLCEIHVVMNVTTVIALAQYFAGTNGPMRLYLMLLAPLALSTAAATLARDIGRGAAEREFAQWYRAGVAEDVRPDECSQQGAQPEIVAADDFVVAGDA